MPRTEKIRNPGTEHWIEYTGPTQDPNGSWKVTGTGWVHLVERNLFLETKTKTAWGKTSEDALQGVQHRILPMVMRLFEVLHIEVRE